MKHIEYIIGYINWELLLKYWEVTRWPLLVLLAFIFFRKVAAYLFLSLREFNFFGTRGKLRDVEEVINEEVQKRYERERAETEIAQKQAERERELESVRGEREQLYTFASDLLLENRTLERNLTNVTKEKTELAGKLKEQVAALLNQIDALQRAISGSPVGDVSGVRGEGGKE